MNRYIDPRLNALWHLGIGKQNAIIKTLRYFYYHIVLFKKIFIISTSSKSLLQRCREKIGTYTVSNCSIFGVEHRNVAGTVANHRESFLGQRGDHDFTRFTVGNRLTRIDIDRFDQGRRSPRSRKVGSPGS